MASMHPQGVITFIISKVMAHKFAYVRNGMNSKTKNKSRLQKVKDDLKEFQKMNNDWFNEYKSLGGKKSKKKYFENLEIFFDETLQIWVYGNPEQHNTRGDSMYAVSEIANIPMKEVNLILESVDNVTAYT